MIIYAHFLTNHASVPIKILAVKFFFSLKDSEALESGGGLVGGSHRRDSNRGIVVNVVFVVHDDRGESHGTGAIATAIHKSD